MPCKIIIKENITSVVTEKTNEALNQTLPIAQSIGNEVNKEFNTQVVSFSEKEGIINRDISIPDSLVDIYYNYELITETPEVENSSKASPETIIRIKEAAEKMGIKILELNEYLKGNPEVKISGINGLADLTQKTIAVAQGMEEVTLTEEIVHVATSILEQTNPKLITELIAKIDRFKIYKDTLENYKGLKAYQLSNGKPDIRKIKKEAVDKLIAELIVNQSEGSDQFPEFTEERERNLIESWWNTIMDYLRGIYKKTNIDIFKEAGEQILNKDIGTIEDINIKGVFFQTKQPNKLLDDFYESIINHDKDLVLNPETPNDKRHYKFQGERVTKSITEQVKESSPFNPEDRTELQKINDESKREWGSKGHEYIEEYIANNLIDKDGYALETPNNISIKSDLPYEQIKVLKNFAKSLINSYSPGTRFIVERKVVDTKVKGLLASTVDFVAIEPDSKTGFKIDTLDWKFTSINKGTTEDIPWYKQKEWKEQMGAYTKIWKNYGANVNQIRKSRMIPFISNYSPISFRDPKKGLRLTSVEVGDLNDLTKTELHLLPVALNSETTDNPRIDTLLSSLREQYEKLYKSSVSSEEKFAKTLKLNELSKAIRSLHLKLDFQPLVNIGNDFLDNAAKSLSSFKNFDYTQLTQAEIQDKLRSLLSYKASAEKYIVLDDIFLSQVERKNLDEEGKKTLANLEHIATRASRMLGVIEGLEKEYVIQLALKEDITTENSKNSILTPEAPVNWITKTMLEGSKLPSKIINLASNIIMNTNNLVNYKVAAKTNEFAKLLTPLEQEAKQKGKKAFDLIGKVTDKGLTLIKKFDKEFWDKISDAKENQDKKYLQSLINKEAYNRLVKEFVDKNTKEILNTKFSSDEDINEGIKENRIKKLKDSIDIDRESFNGWKSFQFSYIYNQSIKEEDHFSQEFKDMKKSENAYKMWEFFTDLNKKAKDLGYIDKQGLSFMPLIEASILQKFSNTEEIFKESADFFRDLYTVKVNEQQTYSKIDPETGQPRKEIPKYFTKTDKSVKQLSTDLNRIGTLWIEALEKYESNKNLEATLEILHSVEKAKGSLILGPDNKVLFTETGELKINEKENKNAEILKAISEDILYGIQEDVNSLGNVSLSNVTGKFVKDEEDKQAKVISIKKGLNSADTLVKALAVGLKPLIGIANWAGYQFQTFINSGDMYTFSEFEKNNAKITVSTGMSTLEKALLDFILPLNEDVSEEKRREIAKEQGYMEYLSTFSFTDIMMLTNSFPERKLQFANAMSFLDNTMIKEGKLVNIRQYVKREDAKKKYAKDENGDLIMSNTERKVLESSYEERVKSLKEKESLKKVAKIEGGEIVIPGVSQEELAKFRTKIIEYGRNLSGQMNVDNKAGFRRDSMLNSFMMFKGWIPKQVHVRTMDLRKNLELDSWEYGRTRAFAKTITQIGFKNITDLRDIIQGTEKGLKILDDMLEQKREEHYKKTGQHLEITNEEFYDLMRTQISNQFKELGVLFSLLAIVFAVKAAEPPEDATLLEKNRYKFWAKMTNKISEELSFYYNPISTDAITKGSIIPALGLLTKAERALEHLGRETYGHTVDDDDIIKDAHPTKYILNMIPVGYQLQTEVLPYIAPELAKEMGIRVTQEARRQ